IAIHSSTYPSLAPSSLYLSAPQYFQNLQRKFGLLSSDQALTISPTFESTQESPFSLYLSPLQYFQNLQRKFGLLSSDQVLAIDSRTRQLVNRYASDRRVFFRQFSHSMIRMGEAGVLTGTQGEIRRTCSAVN
ncbi:unnamed protein product, partial [Closterium sp. NIES-64]